MPFEAVSYLLGSGFFFSKWCKIICLFVGKFWLMVSLQWKYLCLSTFKLCLLCKLCSFCSSPALHVCYSQKVVLLQLGQVVIQREILFLLFWEVVIQHEVVFYSFRMGSFNGGWCRKIKNACILTSHRINFLVTYIWSCMLFVTAILQKKFATEISKSGTSSSVARTRPGFLICEISKTSRVRSTFCKHVI